MPSLGTTSRPSGLAWTEASLATSFVEATPTEAESDRSSRTARRTAWAMRGGSPNRSVAPPTSRNASSRESGSTDGVNPSRISRNQLE